MHSNIFCIKRMLARVILAVLAVQILAHSQDQLKIAYYASGPSYSVSNQFLQRVKQNGYNYVLLEFTLVAGDWDGAGNAKGTSLQDKLKALFIQTNSYGLRMIPLFQLGSQWSSHWAYTNSQIQWNTNPAGVNTMPTFAQDQNGIDKSFNSLILAIKNGFNAAVTMGLSYSNLDYVHLGHDEPVDYPTTTLLIGRGAADQGRIAALRNGGLTYQQAFQQIYGEEVQRRANTVVANLPNTQVMIYADILDPSHNGGIAWHTWYNVDVTMAGAATSAGIQNTKGNLIVMPWYYDYFGPNVYNTYNAFSSLKNAGLRFVYMDSFYDANNFSYMQLGSFIYNSYLPEFRNSAKGFAAASWDGWSDANPPKTFNALENVAQTAYFFLTK